MPDIYNHSSENAGTFPLVPRVLIMMATYNGANHVREQIDSILAQEGVQVHLRICDDLSSDDTFTICEQYTKKGLPVYVTQNEANLGVGKNFMQMVYEDGSLDFDYFAYSDQDDIWLSDKLITAVRKIQAREDGREPILYYSDVTDFDEFHEWRELSPFVPCEDHPATLLLDNWASGCTMVFNKPLLLLLRSHRPDPMPRIHDSWTHLVARYCGTVIADTTYSGIRRRISGKNVVGALTDHHSSLSGAWRDFKNLFSPPERAMTRAAVELVEGFGDRIKQERFDELYQFLSYHEDFLSRLNAALFFDFYRPTAYGRLLLMLRFFFGRL